MITKNESETIALGKKLGQLLPKGSVVALEGDLAGGKTTFTKGIGEALGVKQVINSPTFTILKIYNGRLPLYHIDAYRLENITQDLGFEDYIDGDGVCVIEWANFIEYVLPDQLLNIEFTINDDDSRTLTLQGHGDKYEEVISKICTQWE